MTTCKGLARKTYFFSSTQNISIVVELEFIQGVFAFNKYIV
jgi:hypothetical protein